MFASKWVWLHNKTSVQNTKIILSLKQLKTANPNSPWACILQRLLLEGYMHKRFGGLFLGELIDLCLSLIN